MKIPFRAIVLLSILQLTILSPNLFAQQMFTLSGSVADIFQGDELTGVKVCVPELQKGTFTDTDGNYTIELPAGNHKVVFSLYSYSILKVEIDMQADRKYSCYLTEATHDEAELSLITEEEPTSRRDQPAIISMVNSLIRIFTVEIWQ